MGIYPDDMKIAKVIAPSKKGKKFDPNNYRPISLLSHFDKIFEKILCKRLISFLEINKIYYCHQFGFRKGYSTAMALMEIIECIKHLLDEKNYVVGIFSDFKKAFDTVDHNIFLSKLDHYGIRGHANMFFRSNLTTRRQYTVFNGVKSDFEYVKYGVPQGSVLDPLFFLLYINYIYRAIGCNAVRLFADDASLIIGNQDLQLAEEKANEMLTKLYRWCLANKLSINKDKTNFVLFHNKNKPIPENLDCIKTENMPIKRVQMVQYLGLIVDENLYWSAHVDYVCMPMVKFFGIFNHVKHFVSKRIDIHFVNILSFVNECRAGRNPDIFKNYFTVREATYDLRYKDRLFVPLTRTELGSSRCAILGAKLWNKYFDEVNPHLFKKSFRKRVTKSVIAKYTL